MSVSIDMYEFRKVLVKSPNEETLNWLVGNCESIVACVVHVGEDGMPRELVDAFRAHGCEGDQAVLVVLQ